MTFGHPENILWLALLPAVIFLLTLGWKKRRERLSLVMSPRIKNILLRDSSEGRLLFKRILFSASVVFLCFALLGPRWGFHWEEVHRKGIDIYIAVDASKSMLCRDVLPDRLERTRMEIKDLLNTVRGDRIGLIAFAGKAFLKCPLTFDTSALQLFLEDIRVEDMPLGGTSLASAIDLVSSRYQDSAQKEKILVVLSDGEDHDGATEKAAQKAKELGITIYTIGVGTAEGGPIPLESAGAQSYVKDNAGNIVISRLNMSSLSRVSEITGGKPFVSSRGTDLQLADIYRKKLSDLERTDFAQKRVKKHHEKYFYFAAAAFLLLTLSVLKGGRKI
jgi:Ca-activated chloride channel homolog